MTCKQCLKQYVGETTDAFRKRWNSHKNNARKFLREESCMQQYLCEQFRSPGYTSFAEDICITFIDTTDPFGFNIEESLSLFWLYLLLCTDIFKYYWCQAACIRTTILGLDYDIRGGFGALLGILNEELTAGGVVDGFRLWIFLQSVSFYMIDGVLNPSLLIVIY